MIGKAEIEQAQPYDQACFYIGFPKKQEWLSHFGEMNVTVNFNRLIFSV